MAVEHLITHKMLESAFHTKFSRTIRDKINSIGFRYENITTKERDQYICDILEVLMDSSILTAGEHRLPQWEKGWGENLAAFKKKKGAESIIPRYHGKFPLVRWKQNIVRPTVKEFEYKMLELIVDWVFDSFFKEVDAICEFGCGPGHHLLRAHQFNRNARLIGLDWTKTSQKIISLIKKRRIESNVEGRNFNFYKPDYTFDIPPNCGIYTVAALEQVGENFEPFIQFLINKKPMVCVHLEPIEELLDPKNLIDSLSLHYFRKRNYLKGFLTRLRELHGVGKISIHREQRTYTGSYFIEGHSLVVWSPNSY